MLKKALKILGLLVVVILMVAGGAFTYFLFSYPDIGPLPEMQIELTPGRLERGRYLAHHVTVCIDCHSQRDWSRFAGPIQPGSEGKGGEKFGGESSGLGVLYAKNITPDAETGIGTWTDAEMLRAFTEGVDRNGGALFPLMPYLAYGTMSQEDAYSLVAYLRMLQPIRHEVPPRKLNFPLNLIVRTMPQPARFQPAPDPSDRLEYGKYLATIGGCRDCHTPQQQGGVLPGMELAGGFEFPLPDGSVVRSANITPDPETGLGNWDEEAFLTRFRFFRDASPEQLDPRQFGYNTVMPWLMFAGMTDDDLSAVYTYLRSVPAVKHQVSRYTPADGF